jgi:hypothetical protein
MRGNMTEATDVEKVLALLSKRIDEQARFTRSVTVICTLLILGVSFYTSTTVMTVMPQLMIASVMGNMEQLVQQWRLIEKSDPHKTSTSAPAALVN